MVAEPGRRRRPVGTCLCLSRSRGVVLVISKHGEFAGTVDGSCGEEHRVDAETRDGGSRELSDTNSTASLVAVGDRLESAQAASVVFHGDRTKWADWAFTFRAYASAVSTRMVVVMEHAQSATEPWDLPAAASDNQANAQLRHVLGMLVKDGAMEKAGNASVGHGNEIWRLKCEEYEPRQRRRFRAMMSAILKVQLREPLGESLDSFESQVHAFEDHCGKLILDEILAATVIAGIDNATVAQLLALNDGTL